jgi:hypothetical protein
LSPGGGEGARTLHRGNLAHDGEGVRVSGGDGRARCDGDGHLCSSTHILPFRVTPLHRAAQRLGVRPAPRAVRSTAPLAPRRVEVDAKRSYDPARREAGCPSSAPRRPHGRRTPASRRGTPRPTSGGGVVAPRVPRARAPGAAAPGTRASSPTTACSGDARVVHDREGTGERSGRAWPPCLGHGRHRRRARTAVSVARSDEFNRPGPVGPQRSAIGRERRDPHAPASRDARRDAPTSSLRWSHGLRPT